MKKIAFLFLLVLTHSSLWGQVEFLSRYEVKGDSYDPIFEVMRTDNGLVSFRTMGAKSFSGERVFQYFISDQNLKSPGVIELPIQNSYDMIGYDTEGNNLYILLAKGKTATANKYILEVDLVKNIGKEYAADNLLNLDLVEFLIQNKKAVFMGMADARPAMQILDLETKSLHTVQGVYGNNTQVLQVRKSKELEALEVVVSRKGQYRNREILVLTYDMQGNLVREVKVDQFGKDGEEVFDAYLLADQEYQQVMIGSYGKDSRNANEGMYIMDINEFGEYQLKFYTLEDFPNFYNYLKENQKEKRMAQIQKELDQGKVPSIRNTYAVRDVKETADAFYIYFDHLNITTSRGGSRPGGYSPFNTYRYDRINRMGYSPYYMDPMLSPNQSLSQAQFYAVIDYKYISSHFVKVGKEGNVIWENSASYNDFTTNFQEAFGEVAIVGDDLYHAYIEDDQIIVSFFRNGEKVFERYTTGLELLDENERIRYTDLSTLRLVHWYDNYFLISGKQSVRRLNEQNREEVNEVFFLTKIVLDGDLYQPEKKVD